MEYNTEREHLKLKEYGRNIQRMVNHLITIEEKEQRDSYASTVVELMKHVNPNVKDLPEYDQKVWDDLFIISDFKLEAEGPYVKPDANILERKPERVEYKSNQIKYRHYGRSIEILIDQAIALEDPDDKKGAVIAIGKLMKSFYQTWNKEVIEDEQVLKTIISMSKKQLDIDIEEVKEFKLFDMGKRERSNDFHRKSKPHHKNKKRDQNHRNKRRNTNQ